MREVAFKKFLDWMPCGSSARNSASLNFSPSFGGSSRVEIPTPCGMPHADKGVRDLIPEMGASFDSPADAGSKASAGLTAFFFTSAIFPSFLTAFTDARLTIKMRVSPTAIMSVRFCIPRSVIVSRKIFYGERATHAHGAGRGCKCTRAFIRLVKKSGRSVSN